MENKYKLKLTDLQKRKLRLAYKKQRVAVLSLKNDQLKNGNIEVFLTDQQLRQINKAKEKNRGLRLLLDYRQLKNNIEGGLLKEIMDIAENNIPHFKKWVSPLVKDKIAPLLKNQFIPWLKQLVDSELDEIISKDTTGAGLKKLINSKLNNTLLQAKKN